MGMEESKSVEIIIWKTYPEKTVISIPFHLTYQTKLWFGFIFQFVVFALYPACDVYWNWSLLGKN